MCVWGVWGVIFPCIIYLRGCHLPYMAFWTGPAWQVGLRVTHSCGTYLEWLYWYYHHRPLYHILRQFFRKQHEHTLSDKITKMTHPFATTVLCQRIVSVHVLHLEFITKWQHSVHLFFFLIRKHKYIQNKQSHIKHSRVRILHVTLCFYHIAWLSFNYLCLSWSLLTDNIISHRERRHHDDGNVPHTMKHGHGRVGLESERKQKCIFSTRLSFSVILFPHACLLLTVKWLKWNEHHTHTKTVFKAFFIFSIFCRSLLLAQVDI